MSSLAFWEEFLLDLLMMILCEEEEEERRISANKEIFIQMLFHTTHRTLSRAILNDDTITNVTQHRCFKKNE